MQPRPGQIANVLSLGKCALSVGSQNLQTPAILAKQTAVQELAKMRAVRDTVAGAARTVAKRKYRRADIPPVAEHI
jgi:hypothetical protein